MAAPANDNFANAQVITGSSGSVSWTNVDATFQSGEYYDGFVQHTVWFVWTCPDPAPSSVTFTISEAIGTDSWLSIIDGFNGPTLFGESHTDIGGVVTFVPTANDVYYLYVQDDPSTGYATGSGDIVWAGDTLGTEDGVLYVVTSDGVAHSLCCGGRDQIDYKLDPGYMGNLAGAENGFLVGDTHALGDGDDATYVQFEPSAYHGDMIRDLPPVPIPLSVAAADVLCWVTTRTSRLGVGVIHGFSTISFDLDTYDPLGIHNGDLFYAHVDMNEDGTLVDQDTNFTDPTTAPTEFLVDLMRNGHAQFTVNAAGNNFSIDQWMRYHEATLHISWPTDSTGHLFLVLGPSEVYQQCCDDPGVPLTVATSGGVTGTGACMVPYTL